MRAVNAHPHQPVQAGRLRKLPLRAQAIPDELFAVCEPVEMTISGAFGARGGISLTVEVRHEGEVAKGENLS